MSRTLRVLGRGWFALSALLFLVGFAGLAAKESVSAAVDVFSPFNVANTFVMLLTIAPGLLAFEIARRIDARQPLTLENAQKIVRDYGVAMESRFTRPLEQRSLPAPKERVKEALRLVAINTTDPKLVSILGVGFVTLADFSPLRSTRSSAPRPEGAEAKRNAYQAEATALLAEWKAIESAALARIESLRATVKQ